MAHDSSKSPIHYSSISRTVMAFSWLVVLFVLLQLRFCLPCGAVSDCKLQSELEQRLRCSTKVRPLVDKNSRIQVTLNLMLIAINTIQEQQQIFHAHVWLELAWKDCSLMWDPRQYEGTDSVLMDLKNLWRPDLCFMNDVADDKCIRVKEDDTVLVNSNGKVHWWLAREIKAHCDISINKYPFDEQICGIAIGKLYWTDEKVELRPKFPYVSMKNYKPNGEWNILNSSIKYDKWKLSGNLTKLNFKDIIYQVVVRRRPLFYIYYIIVPVVLLSILNVICFVIPIESGEKVGLAVAIFLTFAVFMSMISNSVPKLSNHQFRLGIYMTIEMVVSGVTIVMEVFVLGLYHRSNDIPIGWPYRLLQPRSCCRSGERRLANVHRDSRCDGVNSPVADKEILSVWQGIAKCIDKIFGILVAFVNILSFVVFVVGILL